nr:MAG TPA: hypothetical protein [Caudoviricetes sp.]
MYKLPYLKILTFILRLIKNFTYIPLSIWEDMYTFQMDILYYKIFPKVSKS